MKKLTIAVDFDGTCVNHVYPKVGEPVPLAVGTLQDLVKQGHRLILWTMRSNLREDGTNLLTDAVEWFEKHNIPLFGIQSNPEQASWTTSPKCYADVYFDDLSFGSPLLKISAWERPVFDWEKVRDAFNLDGNQGLSGLEGVSGKIRTFRRQF
jgi:hypothetical protein